MKERYKLKVIVYLFLRKGNKILMFRRHKADQFQGLYGIPAGHLEKGEFVTDAAIREAKEEIGIEIKKKNLNLIHVMHAQFPDERIIFVFSPNKYENEPVNNEIDKHDKLDWYDSDNLPKDIVPYVNEIISQIKQNNFYSEYK